jgi:hypothetical protein
MWRVLYLNSLMRPYQGDTSYAILYLLRVGAVFISLTNNNTLTFCVSKSATKYTAHWLVIPKRGAGPFKGKWTVLGFGWLVELI